MFREGENMYFGEMDISQKTKKALKERGFELATDVQEKAIYPAMQGDVIVQARTGSGKTLSFLIPVFEGISGEGNEALILVPTRELAQQVEREAREIAKEHRVRTVAIYGGVSMEPQIKGLPASIIVGTPGRIMDLMRRGYLDLSNLKFLILDEADRMLDMGFIDDIRWIISRTNRARRTLMYSATMPEEIIRLAKRYMRNPRKILLSSDSVSPEKIEQYYVEVNDRTKYSTLKMLINSEPGKYLIFCNTRLGVKALANKLERDGYRAKELHGDMTQGSRTRVMESYRQGMIDILVATDVASRGIDVKGITHVVNYDVPRFPKDYVHRIGRTGRLNSDGRAVTLTKGNEMLYLQRIEGFMGLKLKKLTFRENRFEEVRDYRDSADAFGMIKVNFSLLHEMGEWEVIKEAGKYGISEEDIGMMELSGKQGVMHIHYAQVSKLLDIPMFSEVKIAVGEDKEHRAS